MVPGGRALDLDLFDATAQGAVFSHQLGDHAHAAPEGHHGQDGLVYVLTVLARDGKVARIVVDATKGTLVGGR